MLFPRISALSEALWSQKENKNWDDFQKRLMTQFKRYELWKVNYSKAFFDLKSSILPTQNFSGIKWKLESRTFTDDILIYKWNNKSEADRNIVSNKKECTRTIQSGGLYYGSSQSNKVVNNLIKQEFHFNLATGKKITPLTPISEKYPGDGAFTLVNGVQNEKGFARSKEFIAYEGKDCEVVIDLGKDESFASATIHTLRRESSWIYPPSSFEVFTSADGSNYTSAGATSGFTETNSATGNGVMQLNFSNDYNVRYIKIVAKNFGNIPAGKPGAGHKAWLFLDEIEVN
jgi:hexosaminidase